MKAQPARTYGNAVLRGKFIAVNACNKNTERSQIKNLMLHFKLLKKKNNLNPKQAEERQ
jgi:hypothetical protein